MASPDIAAQAKRAFLDALAAGESGGRYDVLWGGGRFADFSRFPEWSGMRGPAGMSHAAGRYQFEPATWRYEAQKLGLGDFSPASQDAAAWDLAAGVYRAQAGRDLLADLLLGRLDGVAPALRSTWTSLSPATFPARFRAALGALQPPPVDINVNGSGSVDTAPAPQSIPDLVRELQRRLAAAGYYGGAIDGDFGPRSYAAIQECQDAAA